MEKFDSICMLLITIGESLKNLDKVTNGELLSEYPEIDWKKVKGCYVAHPTTLQVANSVSWKVLGHPPNRSVPRAPL
jgi:uncharacterized protein with HEPN domain